VNLGYAIHHRRVPVIVEQPGLDAGKCTAIVDSQQPAVWCLNCALHFASD
jgi:hypothetical protein